MILPNAKLNTTRYEPSKVGRRFIPVTQGDLVLISEWDNIAVVGIVTSITKHSIQVKHAKFLSGAYESVADYSKYEEQTAFFFESWSLHEIVILAKRGEYNISTDYQKLYLCSFKRRDPLKIRRRERKLQKLETKKRQLLKKPFSGPILFSSNLSH